MTAAATPLALTLLGVAAWGLSLAVISARPELFLAVLPLVLTLASLAWRRACPAYSVSQEISDARLFEGAAQFDEIADAVRSAGAGTPTSSNPPE